jgi:hypothetical protein
VKLTVVGRSVVVETVGATVVGADVGADVGTMVNSVGVREGVAVGTPVGAGVGGAMQRSSLVALTRHVDVLSHGLLANIAAGPPADPAE